MNVDVCVCVCFVCLLWLGDWSPKKDICIFIACSLYFVHLSLCGLTTGANNASTIQTREIRTTYYIMCSANIFPFISCRKCTCILGQQHAHAASYRNEHYTFPMYSYMLNFGLHIKQILLLFTYRQTRNFRIFPLMRAQNASSSAIVRQFAI